jgi:phosphoglycolate phosphatase-like HAD superfamily hydrolase
MIAKRFLVRSTGCSMIKVIIFDFDGVIVESVNIKTQAFAELFKDEESDVVRRIIKYHLQNGGVSRYDKFRYIYAEILHRPLPRETFEKLCNSFASLVFNGVVTTQYVPGAIEFLQDNKGRYRCFIASATPSDELEKILDRREITRFFERIFGAPITKDEAVKVILNLTGVPPEDAVFLGDALSDFDAAQINNVPFIARIHDNNELFKNKGCLEIHNLLELKQVLKRFD